MPKPQNQEMWGQGYHHLIDAVKPHKAIYCKYHPMFNNKRHKLQLWQEVCRQIVPGWEGMSLGERGEKLNDVQRGWKTVRDGFSRELHNQRQDKKRKQAGEEVKKRKLYGYFHDLLFLLDGKDIDEDELDIPDPLDSSYNDNDNSYSEEEEQPSQLSTVAITNVRAKKEKKKKEKRKCKQESENSSYVEVPYTPKKVRGNIESNAEVEEKDDNDIDDDKHFCLSLVPSFKKMTDKQKFEARIAVLQIMEEISFRNDTSDVSYTQANSDGANRLSQ